jgi:multicomponent Na+:H+ antiporter subunit B
VNTLIFRTMAPVLGVLLAAFSLLILLGGHNAPGGGFAGGLVAAAAAIVYGMARGVTEIRRLLRLDPLAIAGIGGLVAIVSGLASLLAGKPFLTGFWLPGNLFGTPGVFDIGIYFTVFGAVTGIALALEEGGEGA